MIRPRYENSNLLEHTAVAEHEMENEEAQWIIIIETDPLVICVLRAFNETIDACRDKTEEKLIGMYSERRQTSGLEISLTS